LIAIIQDDKNDAGNSPGLGQREQRRIGGEGESAELPPAEIGNGEDDDGDEGEAGEGKGWASAAVEYSCEGKDQRSQKP
jgi:hypothetical protein